GGSDAATREGAEVGCQSDPGGGSRIARLLPAVGLAKDVGEPRMGRSALIVVALLLLAVVPVSAQDADRGPSDRVLRISFAGAIAAHTADITTTAYCLGQCTCHAVNPALRWAERKPV